MFNRLHASIMKLIEHMIVFVRFSLLMIFCNSLYRVLNALNISVLDKI